MAKAEKDKSKAKAGTSPVVDAKQALERMASFAERQEELFGVSKKSKGRSVRPGKKR